ncbi:hypothetical protein KR222_009037 [Zaprionus bogoriensis]|nr:hypothetical protein KR222_009037 [Zaprionus bogoriensis]
MTISRGEADQSSAGLETLKCPPGYVLVNRVCFMKNLCPEGYSLRSDGLCYCSNNAELTIATNETTTTTTTTPSTTTTTTVPTTTTPAPTAPTTESTTTTTTRAPSERCPPGAVFHEGECKQIVCTHGEYFQGRCVVPACPKGTVWSNKQCLPQNYVITKLVIKNVVTNKHNYQTSKENAYNVDYQTVKPYDPPGSEPSETIDYPEQLPSLPPTLPPMQPPTDTEQSEPQPECCLVKSPRVCYPRSPVWTCFNRYMKYCDPRICKRAVVYIRPPKVEEVKGDHPGMLVMPPNPPLKACRNFPCKEGDQIDCSGCALGKAEQCPVQCYSYNCLGNDCYFMELKDFCALYPNNIGCTLENDVKKC